MKDAINSIPDFGFINNPDQRRNALLNKADAIENMLKVNDTFGAAQKLQFDLKDKMEKWLTNYTVGTPLEFTKPKMLSLIENILSRLAR